MISILKIKLRSDDTIAEFDLHFTRIPNGMKGYDVTANWKSLDIDSKGIFYTDSNGMGLVKRITDEHKNQYFNHYMRPSANYYPVTSAIMIEDP